jgi:hypothetical protein
MSITNTFTGAPANWNTAGSWSLGTVPAAGEDVVIPAGQIAVMDVARVPATGTLASITCETTGYITCSFNDRSYDINATKIQAGTAVGSIQVTGTTAEGRNILTIVTGTGTGEGIIGGSYTNAYCVYCTSATYTFNIDGKVTGGYGSAAHGVYTTGNACTMIVGNNTATNVTGGNYSNNAKGIKNDGTGSITITGNLLGGAAISTHAVEHAGATGAGGFVTITGSVTGDVGYGLNVAYSTIVTITGDITGGSAQNSGARIDNATTWTFTGNLINTTAMALQGRVPTTWNNPAGINIRYCQFGTGGIRFAPELAANEIKKGVQNGTVTGTLSTTTGIM